LSRRWFRDGAVASRIGRASGDQRVSDPPVFRPKRLELTGKDGNAIELQRRIDQMSDEELKARVAELIAKL
jgi:hypothetical protein